MKNQKKESNQDIKVYMQPNEPVAHKVADSTILSATDYLDILDRMKQATGTKSDTAFAQSIGIRQSSVSAAKERQSIPPAWAVQIAQEYGVSMDWLMFGREAAASKIATAVHEDETIYNGKAHDLACSGIEISMVPMVEARLSAGCGSWETSADSDRGYAFRTEFLRRKGNTKAMVLMRVAGDSMEPEVKDNDIVLIDTANTTPLPGRLYAVAIQDMVYIKMIDAAPDKLVLTSANPAYLPIEVDARGDLGSGIKIVGKAVWVGRELD